MYSFWFDDMKGFNFFSNFKKTDTVIITKNPKHITDNVSGGNA